MVTEIFRIYECLALYIGDFNSHHQEWGYETNNMNRETLHDHITNNKLYLIYNLKRIGTFKSIKRQKGLRFLLLHNFKIISKRKPKNKQNYPRPFSIQST